MGQRKIQKQLKIFVERAKKSLKAQQVVLFGSYARGQANEYSDVDVVVLSDVFSKIPKEKRLDLIYPLTTDFSVDFHPYGFTPAEFNSPSSTSVLSEIKKFGKVVWKG